MNIPGKGYVGVGEVTSAVVRFDRFEVDDDGNRKLLSEMPVEAPEMFDETHSEHLVGVRWIMTVLVEEAVKEKGFFGNQNTVARPKSQAWSHTVDRLRRRFGVE